MENFWSSIRISDLSAFLVFCNENLDILRVRLGHGFIAALAACNRPGIAGIEVILTAVAAHDLALRRNAEALGNGFVRFLLHSDREI